MLVVVLGAGQDDLPERCPEEDEPGVPPSAEGQGPEEVHQGRPHPEQGGGLVQIEAQLSPSRHAPQGHAPEKGLACISLRIRETRSRGLRSPRATGQKSISGGKSIR